MCVRSSEPILSAAPLLARSAAWLVSRPSDTEGSHEVINVAAREVERSRYWLRRSTLRDRARPVKIALGTNE